MANGVVFGMTFGVAFGVANGVAYGVTAGVAVGVTAGVAVGVVAGGVVVGVTAGVAVGVAIGVAYGVTASVAYSVAVGVAYGVAVGVAAGVAVGVAYSVAAGVAVGVAYSVAAILATFRVHLWLIEISWVLILYARQLLFNSLPILSRLPFYFDESIILPLPFLEGWLAQSYLTVPNETQKTLNYLTTSTNQQALAAKVKIRIILGKFSKCRYFQDLLPLKDEFSWLPNPLPQEFGSEITQLLNISQDCRSAAQASTPYRAAKQLELPQQNIQNLQKSLSFSQSKHVPILGQIFQRWDSIISEAQKSYELQSLLSVEIPSAYIAGNGLNPDKAKEQFKGRQDIFKDIETISLSTSPPILLLYGGRRTGKTSTLRYLHRRVDSKLLPLLVDLQGAAITSQLSSFVQEFSQLLIEFASNHHQLTIPAPPHNDVIKDPFPALQRWIKTIESLCPDQRFLLCLDQFERLSDVIDDTGSKAPLNFLRSFMQNNPRWTLLFSGSHTLDELEPYWSDALINAQSLRITYLQQSEAIELIREPVQDFPDIYPDNTVERVLYWTHCQPYLIQLLCTVLVENLNRRPEPLQQRPTPDDIDEIIPNVLERGNAYFNELWRNTLTPRQRDILTHFIRQHNLDNIPKSEITPLVRDKEILVKTDDQSSFAVPLVETYCRQQVE